MGATLERTGFSPNIKERRDHSCAIFDAKGRLMAQAAHIPVHLGAMPLMMKKLVDSVTWSPGTMWLCNDPAHGGTHLPDFTLVAPVYTPATQQSKKVSDLSDLSDMSDLSDLSDPSDPNTQNPKPNTPIGFVANRAHHADIGVLAPGSLPLSTELFHERLIIPPV